MSAPNISFRTARSPKALGMILRRRRSSTNKRSSRFVVRIARRWVTGPAADSQSAETNEMRFRYWPFGRLQRAARSLLDLDGVVTTKAIMDWAYPDRGTRRQRISRSFRARRAAVSLGLVKVGRLWPDGNPDKQ